MSHSERLSAVGIELVQPEGHRAVQSLEISIRQSSMSKQQLQQGRAQSLFENQSGCYQESKELHKVQSGEQEHPEHNLRLYYQHLKLLAQQRQADQNNAGLTPNLVFGT